VSAGGEDALGLFLCPCPRREQRTGDRLLGGLKAAVLAAIRRIDELVAETGSTLATKWPKTGAARVR
jgi:hypothetical protein